MKDIIFTIQFTYNYTYTQEARKIHIEISSTVFCTSFSDVLWQRETKTKQKKQFAKLKQSVIIYWDVNGYIEMILNE